jgi:carbonic anhydrase/acetyltransferase-like protein (isoleucine patch superfamily)
VRLQLLNSFAHLVRCCLYRAVGDINAITVGDKTNIQDNLVMHKCALQFRTAPLILYVADRIVL